MNGFEAYQLQSAAWTRIDMLLAAYDGTIARLEQAVEYLNNNESSTKAQPLLVRAQRIVLELYAGLDLRQGEIPANMQRLYLFVLHCISVAEIDKVESAIQILSKIREGLRSIRLEAIALERNGVVHPVDHDLHMIPHAIG